MSVKVLVFILVFLAVVSFIGFVWQLYISKIRRLDRGSAKLGHKILKNRSADVRDLDKNDRKIFARSQEYQKNGRPAQAAQLLESINLQREAITVLENAGMIHEASKVLMRMGKHNRAGVVYARHGYWEKAAESFAIANMPLEVAKCAKEAGDISMAAEHFALANRFSDAGEMLKEVNRPREAAKCFLQGAEYDLAMEQYEIAMSGAHRGSVEFDSNEIRLILTWMENGGFNSKVAKILAYQRSPGDLVLELAAQNRIDEGAEILGAIPSDISANLLSELDYENKAMWEGLAKIFILIGFFEKAGMIFESKGLFERAGIAFAKADNHRRSEYCYDRAGVKKPSKKRNNNYDSDNALEAVQPLERQNEDGETPVPPESLAGDVSFSLNSLTEFKEREAKIALGLDTSNNSSNSFEIDEKTVFLPSPTHSVGSKSGASVDRVSAAVVPPKDRRPTTNSASTVKGFELPTGESMNSEAIDLPQDHSQPATGIPVPGVILSDSQDEYAPEFHVSESQIIPDSAKGAYGNLDPEHHENLKRNSERPIKIPLPPGGDPESPAVTPHNHSLIKAMSELEISSISNLDAAPGTPLVLDYAEEDRVQEIASPLSQTNIEASPSRESKKVDGAATNPRLDLVTQLPIEESEESPVVLGDLSTISSGENLKEPVKANTRSEEDISKAEMNSNNSPIPVEFTSSSFVSDLSCTQQEKIWEIGSTSYFEGESNILNYKDEPLGVYIILAGEVSCFKMTENQDRFVNSMRGGETFGELWLLSGHPSAVRFLAAAGTRIRIIPRLPFNDLLDSHGEIARKVYKRFTARLLKQLLAQRRTQDEMQSPEQLREVKYDRSVG